MDESPINWLLEETNPSIRYFALRDVLGKTEEDSEVSAAKLAIPGSDLVSRIMHKQNPGGYWEDPTNPYHPKYKSSYWQIMILSQLGIDKSHNGIRNACEYIFKFQLNEGGFSSETPELASREYTHQLAKGKDLPALEEYVSSLVHEHQYSCLTGNMAASLIRIGYGDDPRVKKALEWLVKIQNKDGGWLCPYWRAHVRDKHGCFFGTICPLEAFSEAKKGILTKRMREAVEKGAEFMMMHRLFRADHHNYKIINKYWLTLSFPMSQTYNILRGLDVLTHLGYTKDERLNDATEILLDKRQKDGTWILENTPEGRMQANIEPKGKPSKWVTLIALRTLKRLAS